MKNKKYLLLGIVIVVIIIIILGIVFLNNYLSNKPVYMTREYMKKYNKLDSEVIKNIEYDFDDQLSDDQKDKYVEIIKNQYKKLTYKIVSEDMDETSATINVEISVFDLSSAMFKANSYIDSYEDKFMTNGEYDILKANDFKLDELSNYNEKITYSITFNYYKENGNWTMRDISSNDLKKIRGTY